MATLNFRHIVDKIWAERKRLASFFVIGMASLGLNVGLYTLLSRVLWPAGSRNLQYVIVVFLVTVFNFEANRLFTFDSAQRSWSSVMRFGTVALFTMVLNNFLFWFGHTVLHLYDLVVIILATFIVAFFTFSSHRLFTFHPDPWKHVRRFRR